MFGIARWLRTRARRSFGNDVYVASSRVGDVSRVRARPARLRVRSSALQRDEKWAGAMSKKRDGRAIARRTIFFDLLVQVVHVYGGTRGNVTHGGDESSTTARATKSGRDENSKRALDACAGWNAG